MNAPASLTQTVSDLASLDEAGLKRWVRKAVSNLASMDSIGGAQDFLSDLSSQLEAEVTFRASARGCDEHQVRVEEGRA